MLHRIGIAVGLCLAMGALPLLAGNPPDLETNPPSQQSERVSELPAVFIAGDSTAAKGKGAVQQGWAEPFRHYFDPTEVTVFNRARGGRSSRTFITEGLWKELIDDVRAGDVVILQFGHNDGGAINEEPPGSDRPTRARGSLPGLGEESVDILNVVTGKQEIVYTFGHYMRQMIDDVRARNAHPVLVNLTLRNLRDARERLERGSGLYGGWTYQLAREMGVPFIDLTHRLADRLDVMDKSEVDALFEQDYVHFNERGAELHAEQILSGLKGLRSIEMEAWLSEKGQAVKADTTAWLQLPVPTDRTLPTVYLIGDSTVRNGRGDGSSGEWGWGDFLVGFVDRARINVVNRAVGGLSSRTYLTYGHWARVRSMLQPGDVVVMQFGHNDSAPINDTHRARGTLPGVGEQTEAIENLLTGEPEVVGSYGSYLRTFIAESRSAGATPVVCSPVPRKQWKNRALLRDTDRYPLWARQVAELESVAFVDLHSLVADHYEQMGPHDVDLLFADAHTHTSAAGALLNASVFVNAAKQLPMQPIHAWLHADEASSTQD